MYPEFISGRFVLLILILNRIPFNHSANAQQSPKGQGGQQDRIVGLPIYVHPSYPFDPIRNLVQEQPRGRAAEIEEIAAEEETVATNETPLTDAELEETPPVVPQEVAAPNINENAGDDVQPPEYQKPIAGSYLYQKQPTGPFLHQQPLTGSYLHQQPLLASLFPRWGYFSGINYEICGKYPTRLACRYYKTAPWSVSKYSKFSPRVQYRQPKRFHSGFQFTEKTPSLLSVQNGRKLNHSFHRQ